MEIIREVKCDAALAPVLCHMCKTDVRRKKAYWIRVPMAKAIVCCDCVASG